MFFNDKPWFTTHEKILEYLQLYSAHFKLDEITEFNTSVEKLTELLNQSGWKVLTKTARLDQESNKVEIVWKEEVEYQNVSKKGLLISYTDI